MRVMTGWNSEYGRRKFDVTFDETDLGRLLLDNDIPVEQAEKLTPGEVFQLMWVNAEIFSHATLVKHLLAEAQEKAADAVDAEAKEYKDQRTSLVAAIKDRLGSAAP